MEKNREGGQSRPAKLDGAAEAELIAPRLGKPPAGHGHWTWCEGASLHLPASCDGEREEEC
jgi:hypothetical protein